VLHDDGTLHVVMSRLDALDTPGASPRDGVVVRWLGDDDGGVPYVVERH